MNFQLFLRFERIARKRRRERARPRKVLLIGRLLVGVAGSDHHGFDADVHQVVEVGANGVGIGSVEKRGVGGDAKAGGDGCFDSIERDIVSAFAADGEVVVLALAVEVDGEREILAGLEEVKFFFQKQRVGAQIDVLPAGHEALDNLVDLGMQEGLAAGDRNHGRARLIDGFEALFRRQLLLEDVGRILNFAAARARQVAAEERLQHGDEREPLPAFELLREDVGCYRPSLRYRYRHSGSSPFP